MAESFDEYMERKRARLAGEAKPNKIPKPLKKTRLNPVSKKQSKRNREYAKARQEHYSNEDNCSCALCGRTENLSIHHTAKRGDNLSKKEAYLTLCIIGDTLAKQHPELNYSSYGCHGFVEANKSWARQKGYLE